MRFLHAADIHLGYQQYGSKERFNDFAQAFWHVVDAAIEQHVDFVLIAGDLFEKRSVDPLAMRQAVHGLQQLRSAGIPAIMVEGNHERAHYRDQYSWLEFLAALELIVLLDPPVADGKLVLAPYAAEDGGAYVDLPGSVRVYGCKYYGASTERVMAMYQQALAEMPGPRPDYSILVTHAGLDGVLPRMSGAVPAAALAPLHEHINYLALGHIHKPYAEGDWIYNPGSLETWGVDEAQWRNRGYYLVDVERHSPAAHQARLVPTPRRPFQRLRVEVDACSNPEAVYDEVRRQLATLAEPEGEGKPVIELTLEGALAFDRAALDLAYAQSLVQQARAPLLILAHNDTRPATGPVDVREANTRAEMEHQVLRELFARDARYRPSADGWATAALEVKRRALADDSPEAILDYLSSVLAGQSAAPSQEGTQP